MLITFAIYYSIINCGNQIYLCLAIKLSSEIGTTFSSLVAFLAILTVFPSSSLNRTGKKVLGYVCQE